MQKQTKAAEQDLFLTHRNEIKLNHLIDVIETNPEV
jgi:hypothetical protein